jgi:hypothetical protein
MADKEVKKEEKLVTLILDRPMMTNGKALGWETVNGKVTFTGKVEVPADIAEELQERMKLAQESDRARMANNGKTIDAAPGGISVGGV